MTNGEAVSAVAGTAISANSVEKALTDIGLSTEGYYVVENAAKIDLATIEILKGLLATADITEGGYSIKYDRSVILKRITELGTKNNLPEYGVRPTVRAVSVW